MVDGGGYRLSGMAGNIDQVKKIEEGGKRQIKSAD